LIVRSRFMLAAKHSCTTLSMKRASSDSSTSGGMFKLESIPPPFLLPTLLFEEDGSIDRRRLGRVDDFVFYA
jgi:hypothetical protein